jgi:cytochrome c553
MRFAAILALAFAASSLSLSVRAETAADKLSVCLACHGEKGQSETPEVPSLGAQNSPYTLIQIYLFREKQRVFDVMNEATHGLSDGDLQDMADAIAKLPAPRAAGEAAEPQRLAAGKALADRYRCNVCHRPNFAGEDNVPRIAAQREDYLLKTMREYKSNARRGYDASMAEVLQPVSDEEIATLAYFIARQ